MSRSPVQNNQSVFLKPLSDPAQRNVLDPVASGEAGGNSMQRGGAQILEGAKGLDRSIQDSLYATDQAVIAQTYTKAANEYRAKMLGPQGLYSRTPSSLFGDGTSAVDIYKGVSEEYATHGNNYLEELKTPRQKRMFTELWAHQGDVEMRRAQNFIGEANVKYLGEAKTTFLLGADQALAAEQSVVENDWRGWQGSADKGSQVLSNGLRVGVSPETISQKALEWKQGIAASAVRGWFKEQPDRIAAASALYGNAIPDPEARKLWNTLGPNEKQKMLEGLANDTSKIIQMSIQDREVRELGQKRSDEEALKTLMFGGLNAQQRQDTLSRLRVSPHITPDQFRVADMYVRNGGRMADQDVESNVLAAELAIRNGSIKDPVELINKIGTSNWAISDQTARTRLIPLIESRNDKNFTALLDWGESSLGYDKSVGANALFPDKANKALQYRSEMIAYRREHPDGNFEEFARKTLDRVKATTNAATTAAIPILADRLRAAMATGNATNIAAARTALIATMTDANLVDPLQAARSDFNPLDIIDAPRGK